MWLFLTPRTLLCKHRYPKGDANVANISIVVTNVGADFTKLGSFNPPQAFGENLAPDIHALLEPVIIDDLISSVPRTGCR